MTLSSNETEHLIEEFQTYLTSHDMSFNTKLVYTYTIRQFYSLFPLLTLSNLHLYKMHLIEHYKPQTINLRIRAINCYLEYSNLEDKKLVMIKIQQKSYIENVISEADYEYLKSCLKKDSEYLYYFLVRFMAATGARVSEVIQFTREDVNKGHLDILSKDNKMRRIYIPQRLREDVLIWLNENLIHTGYIFLNRYGDLITTSSIRGRLKKYADIYGLNPKVVYPHSFRHRFAKSFIEKCSDITLLADLLGHESIETTRIYLRRSSTEQKQIINQIVDW